MPIHKQREGIMCRFTDIQNLEVYKMENNYSVLITCLKASTYALMGAAGQAIIGLMGEGLDWKTSIATGLVIGVIAGLKNFAKHYFEIDIDLARLKS